MNTPATRKMAHAVTWGLNMVIFSHMVRFVHGKCQGRAERPHLAKFGPVYSLVLGCALIMVDLTRHLLNDAWGTACDERTSDFPDLPAKYQQLCWDTGYASMYDTDEKGREHLNSLGYVGLVCTWTGFALLLFGVFWGIDFFKKMRLHWRAVRGSSRQQPGRETLL